MDDTKLKIIGIIFIIIFIFVFTSYVCSFHYSVKVRNLYNDEKDGYLKEYKNEILFKYIEGIFAINIILTIIFVLLIYSMMDEGLEYPLDFNNYIDGFNFVFKCQNKGQKILFSIIILLLLIKFALHAAYDNNLRKNEKLRKLLDEKVKESIYSFGWLWVFLSFVLFLLGGYGVLKNFKTVSKEECKKEINNINCLKEFDMGKYKSDINNMSEEEKKNACDLKTKIDEKNDEQLTNLMRAKREEEDDIYAKRIKRRVKAGL